MPTTELEKPAATETSPPSTPSPAPAARAFHKRTHYLIDWRSQFGASLWSVGIVFLMLVLVNVMFFHLGRVSTAGLSPQVVDMFNRADNTRRVAVAILSGFFLLGYAALRVLETHKVAGAAYNLCRRLAKIEAGDLTTRVTLRRTDDLQQVAAAVNSMAASLRDHVCGNLEALENLEAQAQCLGPPGRDLVAGIRALLAAERRRIA